jgi:hypothetical protein
MEKKHLAAMGLALLDLGISSAEIAKILGAAYYYSRQYKGDSDTERLLKNRRAEIDLKAITTEIDEEYFPNK